MRLHLIRKCILLSLTLLISFTLVGCSNNSVYKRDNFIYDLLDYSGYLTDNSKYLDIAYSLNLIDSSTNLNHENNRRFVQDVVNNYIEIESIDSSELESVLSNENDDYVDKDESKEIIDLLVSKVNNKEFEAASEFNFSNEVELTDYYTNENILTTDNHLKVGDIFFDENSNTYKKVKEVLINNKYLIEDVSFEDLTDYSFQDSFEVNFEDAKFHELTMDDVLGVESNSNSFLKTKTVEADGYRISYEFSSNSVNARVSKKINGFNFYYDLTLSNITPSFKWDYSKGTINEAYFKVSYKSTDLVGVSAGKYNNYVATFKDVDTSSFKSLLNSVLQKESDEVEAVIPLCSFETPIPNVPMVTIGMELVLRVYVSGKVELAIYNQKNIGFEVINNNFRVISEKSRDIDLIIKGTSKAIAGINFNAAVLKQRIMDIEVDGGIEAYIKATTHLYEKDGSVTSEESSASYDTLDTVTSENENIKVCGDLSLNWVLDINLNTSKALLYKFGFHKTIELLDDDDQIFGNLSHIEDGMFVEKCTRKSKLKLATSSTTSSSSVSYSKIMLKRYSKVIDLGASYEIEVSGIPDDYTTNDLRYSSSDNEVVSIEGDVVTGIKKGTCKVRVYTSDEKYESYINILVSG